VDRIFDPPYLTFLERNNMEEMIIENFEYQEEKDIQLNEIIQEVINRIPQINLLKSPAARRKLYSECGRKAFLDEGSLQFPIMNPKTCDYDCSLLNRTYYELSLSSKPGSADMKHKAKSIMENIGCKYRVFVKIKEDVTIDLDHLISILS